MSMASVSRIERNGTRRSAVIRADASVLIGGGHVRRCFVLAEALAATGWDITFAVRPATVEVVPLLLRSAFRLVQLADDSAGELQQQLPEGCDLLIVDCYTLDEAFERGCRNWAKRILVIDDLANRSHECDVLVDQTPNRTAEAYTGFVPNQCRVLAGSEYALLDPRFRRHRVDRQVMREEVGCVLVNFGNTDPLGATKLALQALLVADMRFDVDVVVGSGTPDLAGVRRMAQQLRPPARLHIDVDDMAALTERADLAVGAGGVGALERCCLGIPSLIIVVADNQKANADALTRAGAALNMGPLMSLAAAQLAHALRELSPDRRLRRSMSEAALKITDGLGPARVRLFCLPPLRAKDGGVVELRSVRLTDADIMLAWQSVPGIRAFTFNPQAPDRKTHLQWLQQKLDDLSCIFNLVLHEGKPAGILRFDRDAQGWYAVTILIAQDHQNLGIGLAALQLAKRLLPHAELRAEINVKNVASVRIFERAGFSQLGSGIWQWAANGVAIQPRQAS
jgi:UDP-2,4-diacetamido-2,4,6-trideoxy-beta-L-altropyranose hydrolase